MGIYLGSGYYESSKFKSIEDVNELKLFDEDLKGTAKEKEKRDAKETEQFKLVRPLMNMTTYTLWGNVANLWCTNPKETELLIVDIQHPEWGEIEIGAVKQISFYDKEYLQLHEDLFNQIYPEDRITDILGDFFYLDWKRDSL